MQDQFSVFCTFETFRLRGFIGGRNFCLPFMVCMIPQKLVSPKILNLEKIVALPFEDLRYLNLQICPSLQLREFLTRQYFIHQ